MKFINMALLLVMLGTISFAMADDVVPTSADTISVDAQIAAIQEAPAEERVRLMNQFKERLANMNAQDRMEAIEQLQTQMHAQGHETVTQNGTELHTQMQEHTQEMQLQATQDMTKMQNMNQHQAGEQFMNELHTPASMSGAGTNMHTTHFLDR